MSEIENELKVNRERARSLFEKSGRAYLDKKELREDFKKTIDNLVALGYTLGKQSVLLREESPSNYSSFSAPVDKEEMRQKEFLQLEYVLALNPTIFSQCKFKLSCAPEQIDPIIANGGIFRKILSEDKKMKVGDVVTWKCTPAKDGKESKKDKFTCKGVVKKIKASRVGGSPKVTKVAQIEVTCTKYLRLYPKRKTTTIAVHNLKTLAEEKCKVSPKAKTVVKAKPKLKKTARK